MKVLVTGATGFVGNHLIHELLKKNHEVFAGTRNFYKSDSNEVKFLALNIENKDEVRNALLTSKPDAIIHLAAQSNVPYAWENPVSTVNTNILGTLNLVTLVSQITPNTKIISVGSSEEYGISAKVYESLDEQVECLPQNPYASSKLSAGQIALQLSKKHDIKLIHTRPFNHFGSGQRKGFAISDFASQIAEIEAGLREPKIYVGNLSTFRDFTDVRDVAKAYVMLMESNIDNGIFNISSGKARQLLNILNQLIEMSHKNIEISVDTNKFRPSEVNKFVGDSTKIKNAVGWSILHNFEDSLKDTLNWWRSQITV